MNSKIFFTDLDGTLLNDKKEITPGNRTAISEALSAGHKIVHRLFDNGERLL